MIDDYYTNFTNIKNGVINVDLLYSINFDNIHINYIRDFAKIYDIKNQKKILMISELQEYINNVLYIILTSKLDNNCIDTFKILYNRCKKELVNICNIRSIKYTTKNTISDLKTKCVEYDINHNNTRKIIKSDNNIYNLYQDNKLLYKLSLDPYDKIIKPKNKSEIVKLKNDGEIDKIKNNNELDKIKNENEIVKLKNENEKIKLNHENEMAKLKNQNVKNQIGQIISGAVAFISLFE